MTHPKTGEILKCLRTGSLFEVKKVTQDFVILCARDGSSQIMTGKRSFDTFFARVSPAEPSSMGLDPGARYSLLAGR
jgi:hypothetical protein